MSETSDDTEVEAKVRVNEVLEQEWPIGCQSILELETLFFMAEEEEARNGKWATYDHIAIVSQIENPDPLLYWFIPTEAARSSSTQN